MYVIFHINDLNHQYSDECEIERNQFPKLSSCMVFDHHFENNTIIHTKKRTICILRTI